MAHVLTPRRRRGWGASDVRGSHTEPRRERPPPCSKGSSVVLLQHTGLRTFPRATKLLARKRPELVPIMDYVVMKTCFPAQGAHWQGLLEGLRADSGALVRRLERIMVDADIPDEVTLLRVFDVLAWIDGSGQSGFAEHSIVSTGSPGATRTTISPTDRGSSCPIQRASSAISTNSVPTANWPMTPPWSYEIERGVLLPDNPSRRQRGATG